MNKKSKPLIRALLDQLLKKKKKKTTDQSINNIHGSIARKTIQKNPVQQQYIFCNNKKKILINYNFVKFIYNLLKQSINQLKHDSMIKSTNQLSCKISSPSPLTQIQLSFQTK